MKMPQTPPDYRELYDRIALNDDRLSRIYGEVLIAAGGKYLHWDKLQYYPPPEGLSHEEWWLAIKIQRRSGYKSIGLKDIKYNGFKYFVTDPIPEMLHKIDQSAAGRIQMAEQITNPDMKDQYYVSSLISEAITSSQLEGAATTRKIAKEMIQTKRHPRDRSEQMILNNFKTMQLISKVKNQPLTKELVFEIQRMVTEKTLDDASESGDFRNEGNEVVVGGMYNEVFHTPPPADQLEARMQAMCEFANGDNSNQFVHPVIRSIILHFWLAYDHPFADGNGRTARALFYWSMLKHGYWLFEFISISQVILNAPSKYGRAFLYTETDDNDLTYFILYHLEVIDKAIDQLHDYIERKTRRLKEVEQQMHGLERFNYRQRTIIAHALRHPNYRYTVKSHQFSHNIVYQTARTDLLDLYEFGLLTLHKPGKAHYFTPVADMEAKLESLSE